MSGSTRQPGGLRTGPWLCDPASRRVCLDRCRSFWASHCARAPPRTIEQLVRTGGYWPRRLVRSRWAGRTGSPVGPGDRRCDREPRLPMPRVWKMGADAADDRRRASTDPYQRFHRDSHPSRQLAVHCGGCGPFVLDGPANGGSLDRGSREVAMPFSTAVPNAPAQPVPHPRFRWVRPGRAVQAGHHG